jgi:hypothetical protein
MTREEPFIILLPFIIGFIAAYLLLRVKVSVFEERYFRSGLLLKRIQTHPKLHAI